MATTLASDLVISENLTSVNYNSGRYGASILYLVIHYTGNNGDTAYNNTVYFKSTNRGASAHYFVDENSIWLCVKDTDTAWHCGTTGTYYHVCRNTTSIGIELCSRKDSSGNYYFKEETVANAVKLAKYLMAKYNIPVANVIRHYDVTHKVCPEPYVRSTTAWNNFKAMLTATTTTNTKEEVDMTEAEVKALVAAESASAAKAAIAAYKAEEEAMAASDYATTYWSEAIANGIFDGTMPRGPLAREQAATVFGKMGILDIHKLKDKACPAWGRVIMQWAIDNGLVNGDGEADPTVDNVRPLDNITRLEVAAMLFNFYGIFAEINVEDEDT